MVMEIKSKINLHSLVCLVLITYMYNLQTYDYLLYIFQMNKISELLTCAILTKSFSPNVSKRDFTATLIN